MGAPMMLKTNDLISEMVSLPVDMRAMLANKLLESLNPTASEVDSLWADVAERRVQEIQTGKVKTIPGNEVFNKIRNRMK